MYVCIKCCVGDLTTLGRFAGSMSVDLQLSRYVNADGAFILYVPYVCMYICMCIYVVCMYTCMFVHLFIHLCTVCMYVCMYAFMFFDVYVRMYVCMMYYEVCVYEVQDRVFVNGFMHCMYVCM
jgi:hypothetical protein